MESLSFLPGSCVDKLVRISTAERELLHGALHSARSLVDIAAAEGVDVGHVEP